MVKKIRIGQKCFQFVLVMFILWLVIGFVSLGNELEAGKKPLMLNGYHMVDTLNEEGVRSTEITLLFSKNVVNMIVSKKNKQCFQLIKNEEQDIPINIVMADDQIEREKRHMITIIPREALDPLSHYRIVILPELEAKNGITLEQGLTLEFTTLGVSQ